MEETTTTTEPNASQEQTGGAETPSFASFVGDNGTLNEGWKNTISEEYRGEKCLDLFTDVNGMVKTLVHSQKAFGKDKVVVPGETSPPEEIAAFKKAWGTPESIEDYSFARDEAIPEDAWRPERVEEFKKIAHEAGFNQKQMAAIEGFYNNMVKTDLEAFNTQSETAKADAEQALRGKWGDAYDDRLHLANRVVNDTTEDGPARAAILEAIGNNPAVVEWIADQIGTKLVESKAVDTTLHRQTPTEISQQIVDFQATPGYMSGEMKRTNPHGYKLLHDKITRLYQEANPE